MSKHELNLGSFEEAVMLSIRALKSASGMDILARIEEMGSGSIAPGAVYATLDRLYAKNYVSFAKKEKIAERGGRAKKMFYLTELGEKALEWMEEFRFRLA